MSKGRRPKPDYLIARSQNRYNDYPVQAEAELLPFLIEKITNGNRQKAKYLLTNRLVLIDKVISTQYNTPLKPGMLVQISKQRGDHHEFRHPQIQLLYEDAYLLVIKKKEGLLAVATDTQKERTAQHILTDYVRRSNPRGRVYVVHRLDRATSGIMMFAKDEKTQRTLRDNWHQIVYDRRYIAVVEGNTEEDQGVVRSFLIDHGMHVISTQQDTGEGKLAITHFRTIRRGNNMSLVELQLETGRKNQIRVHMKDLGHIIVGDRRYGAFSDPLGRMCLHAFKLCFYHPITRERMQFEEEYPARFKGLTVEQ